MDLSVAAIHGEASGIQPLPRSLTIEDNIMNQIDRIGYLRSIGEDWKEPVFHLRDLLVGLEDAEFWDGIPMNLRDEFKESKIPENDLIKYKKRGWDSIPIRIIRLKKNGRIEDVASPTAIELSQMLRIIMALLARRGMTWRRTTYDTIKTEEQE